MFSLNKPLKQDSYDMKSTSVNQCKPAGGWITFVRIIITSILLTAITAIGQTPITISTYADFLRVGKDPGYPLSGHYILGGDIDASASRTLNGGRGFEPIGTEANPFTGRFEGKDGKFYTIRGLYINRRDNHAVGLFGVIGGQGVISHIGVYADTVVGNFAVGGLAGVNYGRVISSFSVGPVRALRNESNVGGLVGVNGGIIEGSYSAASVDGREKAGGLVGLLAAAPHGIISESYALGDVSGMNYVGGLVGYLMGGNLEKCFSAGRVMGRGERSIVGGLAGGDFTESNPSWSTRARQPDGGFVTGAKLVNCFWDVNASGVSSSAGGSGAGSTGMSTEEMMNAGTFTGWDFGSTWSISPGSYYPQLQESPLRKVAYRAAGGAGRFLVGETDVLVDSSVMILSEGVPTIPVTAVPGVGHRFVIWSDGLTDSVRSDIAAGDTAFFANFESIIYGSTASNIIYAVNNEEHGRLSISVGNARVESYRYNMRIAEGELGSFVEAVPNPGYDFWRWSDGFEGSVRRDPAMNADTIYAYFTRNDVVSSTHVFLYIANDNGSLRVSGVPGRPDYYSDPAVPVGHAGSVIAAVPDDGFRFVRWNDGNTNLVRTDNATNNMTFMAVFSEVGAGSEFIKISNYEELRTIGTITTFPVNGKYELVNNIDAAGEEAFTPIGTASVPFSGVFRGNGFKITGLTINRPDDDGVGLFGFTAGAGISGLVVEGNVRGRESVGILVGSAVNTVIDSCGSAGVVIGGHAAAGGLAGRAVSSVISRSYSQARVEGASFAVGGLAGTINRSIITLSWFDGIADGKNGVGGVAGDIIEGAVQYSYSRGSVKGESAVGGLAGQLTGGVKLIHCYSAGKVTAPGTAAGGLVGVQASGAALERDCFWDMTASATGRSAVGLGKITSEMILSSSYTGWDFNNVWNIENGAGYPFLTAIAHINPPDGLTKQRTASVYSRPPVSVRGKVLTVNVPAGTEMQVKLINMKGRTVVKYDTKGSAKIRLTNIPSGKYMAEIRQNGKRVSVTPVVLK